MRTKFHPYKFVNMKIYEVHFAVAMETHHEVFIFALVEWKKRGWARARAVRGKKRDEGTKESRERETKSWKELLINDYLRELLRQQQKASESETRSRSSLGYSRKTSWFYVFHFTWNVLKMLFLPHHSLSADSMNSLLLLLRETRGTPQCLQLQFSSWKETKEEEEEEWERKMQQNVCANKSKDTSDSSLCLLSLSL
jgi:hypothetical protein